MDGRNVRETESQQRKCSEPRHERTAWQRLLFKLPLLGIKNQTRHGNVLAQRTLPIGLLFSKRTRIMCARCIALLIKKTTSNYFSFLKRPERRRLIEPVLLAAADQTVWLATRHWLTV